ncbi:MAG: NAD(P)H-dependent oxidoreductase [Negativicutes bacterium]|nr:NAD(P)H-dependent oxidoreductase [Negativicutes bacterium]
MKVLALVASARKLGNSEILAKEMLASLPDDVEKAMIRLTDLEIRHCNACYACLPEDKDCVIQDDLSFLIDAIKAADAVIIAAPCYFLGEHTMLKLIGDRMIALLSKSRQFAGKRCVIAVSYGIDGWEGYAREATINFARFMHLDVLGDMLIRATGPGEVVQPAVLDAARQLAARLLTGERQLPNTAFCTCELCGSTLLQLTPTGKVACRMCQAEGTLRQTADGFNIQFAKPEHYRFSPEGMDEHAERLMAARNQFIADRQQLNLLRKPYQKYDWWLKPDNKKI